MVELQYCIFSFLIWPISLFFLLTIYAKTRPKPRLPPSPMAIPIIGHLHLLGPIPHQALHKLSLKHGPFVHFFLGSKLCLLVSSPEIVKEIFRNHESNFMNRPYFTNLDYLTYGLADLAMAPYGPLWKFMKKICMVELLGSRTVEQLLPVRREETRQFLRIMKEKAKAGEAVDVGAQLMRLTNNIISRMLVNQRCSDDEDKADEVRTLVKEMNSLGTKFNLQDLIWFCKDFDLQRYGKRLKDVRNRYDILMEKIIREHKEDKQKREMNKSDEIVRDLLDILLDISEDENAEMKLSRENVKALIMNLFGAGTDTSSVTIAWGVAELINNPEVMEKARREIDSVVGKNRIVEESDVPNLPYLQAVVKEILRLHPGGPLVVRESIEDCTISGYQIPAQTRLFVNVWSLGRDPSQWESPLEFKPERFLSPEWKAKSQLLDVRGSNFSLLPFGTGRRGCPGASLALQVVPATLGAMIQCFEWKVEDAVNGKVDMEEKRGMTLLRAKPLFCVPVARLNPFPSF
ncbi:cytochrome P450 93A2-like [Mangifera indica]|uniref:cytochrome P450 93A2-like n=1 Tax=Mangifera indica TaxID=29780 RepID=UPI001CFB7EEE|nr:cytochrome P450 93A2-like [Mangifera indica]